MVKLRSTKRISLETVVKIRYIDNMHGFMVSDLGKDEIIKNGVPTLTVYGSVVGKSQHYIFLATQHPSNMEQSENGYNIVGVLWKCVENIKVLK